ncbi:MAG: phytoene desaturase family protein, partial [Parachlamydiaceae bacterium]
MLKKKKVLCIGAGFGGIAAALRLRAKGFDVQLIDRLPKLGGRAQVFEKEGFIFDGGPTVLTAPFLFEELFQLFNKKINDYVEILPLDLWYRYQFDDGKSLDYGRDLMRLFNDIEKFNPRDVEGYKKLLKFSEAIFDVGFQKLSDQPFSSMKPLLKALPSMIKLKSYKSVYSLVSSFIEDDYLRKAFTISPLLVGGNPFNTTSIYALIHFLERKWGVHFPKGGTNSVGLALKRLMEEEGIDIKLNTSIKEILVKNGKAQGAICDSGEKFEADIVVVNGDPAYTYKNLFPHLKRKKWTDEKIDKLTFSMGLFVLYFGTNIEYPDIPHHTILFGKTYKELLSDIFDSKILSNDLSLYLHRPSATDRSF